MSIDIQMSDYDNRLANPHVTGKDGITKLITDVLEKYPTETPVNEKLIISLYAPTPTVIEAARTLYENHSVENIPRHEADKVSTDQTIACILDVIQNNRQNHEKSGCFVTGVPDASKTLIGLDVVMWHTYSIRLRWDISLSKKFGL